MPTFRVALLANNIQWPSLLNKIAQIQAFYAPVCNLVITVEHTSLHPVFNSTYPGLAPIAVVDFDWYDANISGPRAAQYDIIIFAVSPNDHVGTTTYQGHMTQHNMGPWETTVFAGAEDDHVYVNGVDFGNTFVHYACHELSHVFYYMLGKRDDTHVHFPVGQTPYNDEPQYVIKDFGFTQASSLQIKLAYFKDLLTNALAALGRIKKQRLVTIGDNQTPVAPTPVTIDPMTPPMILKWAKAIAVQEGGKPGLNNPGNLKVAPLTKSWGATNGFQATDGGWIARFATPQAGQTALCNFLLLGAENQLIAFHKPEARTLGGFTKIYAGNPPPGYIHGITAALGVPETTQISTFL